MSVKKSPFSYIIYSSSLCFLMMFLASFEARSSHMAGAELSYEFEGNDRYRLTYTLYTDCAGSLPPSSVNLMVRSVQCNLSSMHILSFIPGSEIEVGTNCTSSPSICNGGSSAGFKKIKYSGSILLTEKCKDIIFSVTDCCRNSSITSIINPEIQALYVEAHLNNFVESNNSPVFDSKPILILNTNQLNQISESSIDSDGDSLVYSLIAPKTSEITSVNYALGYSADQFLNTVFPIQFNTETGTISLIPTGIETTILAVKVTEFRNGEFIGSTMRDIQLITTTSNNHLPSIQQLDAMSSSIIKLCKGEDLTINLSSVDPDAGQQTFIDVSSNITELSISKSTDRLQKVQLKWVADNSNLQNENHWIKITITDNACPMNGVKTYYIEIKVSELNVDGIVTNSDCKGKNNGSIFTTISGSQTAEFVWSNLNSTQSFVTGLAAGTYNVLVDNMNGCKVNKTFQVRNSETMIAEISTEKSTCGYADGKAEISISGGTLPYLCTWNDGIIGQERLNLKKGSYSFVVTDQIGCSYSTNLSIESEECLSADSQFKLYPNPAMNHINLQNDHLNSTIISISISDVSGKIVFENDDEFTDNLMTSLEIGDLSKGIYLVKIISIDQSQTLSFVKL